MSIIRAPRPTANFTVLDNATIYIPTMSWRARGILHGLLGRPDNWRTDASSIAREGTEGREAVLTALKELEDHGYLRRVKTQDEKGHWSTVSYVYDTPQPVDVKQPETPKTTGVGFPDFGLPDAGQPDAGQPDAIINTKNKNLEQKNQNLSQSPKEVNVARRTDEGFGGHFENEEKPKTQQLKQNTSTHSPVTAKKETQPEQTEALPPKKVLIAAAKSIAAAWDRRKGHSTQNIGQVTTEVYNALLNPANDEDLVLRALLLVADRNEHVNSMRLTNAITELVTPASAKDAGPGERAVELHEPNWTDNVVHSEEDEGGEYLTPLNKAGIPIPLETAVNRNGSPYKPRKVKAQELTPLDRTKPYTGSKPWLKKVTQSA